MARQTEIILSLRDQVSPTINSIRNSGNRLNKDLDSVNATMSDMMKRQDALRNNQVDLQATIVKTSAELRDAKKAYRDLNDEQSRSELVKVQQKYNEERDALREYNRELRDTSKELRNLDDQRSKIENRAGSDSLFSGLATAGLGNMLADSAQGFLDVTLTSALGSTAGSSISNTLSGALSGAAVGSLIPVVGPLIGAAVGTVSGMIESAAQIFQEKDDYFKSYRDSEIERVDTLYDTKLESGIGIFSQRELLSKAFEGDLGEERATEFIQELARRDAENPFTFDDMATLSRTFFGFGLSEEQIYQQLDNIGNLGAARGLGAQDMDMVAKTLAAMPVSPSITRIDLQKLTTRGIPVLDYLGDAYGLAADEIYENLKNFDPTDVFNIITRYMSEDPRFAGAMSRVGETYAGREDMLEAAYMNQDYAFGEGYGTTRAEGQQEELEFLESEVGEAMEASFRAMGVWEAELENQGEEIKRAIFSAIYSGEMDESTLDLLSESGLESLQKLQEEYLELADEDGAEAGRIWKEAEILAKGEFNDSEGMQLMFAQEETLVKEVTTLLQDEYWQSGYDLQQLRMQGMKAAFNDNQEVFGLPEGYVIQEGSFMPEYKEENDGSYAFGLSYVPRDGYRVELHEGEQVSTAREARARRAEESAKTEINISVTGNHFGDETQIDYFASQLVAKLEETTGTM